MFRKYTFYTFFLHMLKLHNCFVYFIQTINPWRMVFYFFILRLRVIKDLSFFFLIDAPPKQA